MTLSFQKSAPISIVEKIVQVTNRIGKGETITEPNFVLSNVTINDLNFCASSLIYMTAVETQLKSCNLERTNLSGMDYRNGEIKNTSFSSANLVKASIYSCILENVNFKNCNFDRSEFADVQFKEVSFKNASLIGASFDNCDLRGVDFDMAKFDGTHFFGCILDEKIKNLPGIELKGALM